MKKTDEFFDVIVRGGAQGFRQEIEAGSHRLQGDEPAAAGGTDAGPSPYEFLLAALGTCTSITLRMYADRKQWPLKGVMVKLRHFKTHAEDCADCETKEGYVDRIERLISLEGPLSEEQRSRLMEIANHCPVHRTLTSEIKIQSTLV
jgi:uncharacterized OsmC-like protein